MDQQRAVKLFGSAILAMAVLVTSPLFKKSSPSSTPISSSSSFSSSPSSSSPSFSSSSSASTTTTTETVFATVVQTTVANFTKPAGSQLANALQGFMAFQFLLPWILAIQQSGLVATVDGLIYWASTAYSVWRFLRWVMGPRAHDP